MENYPYELAQNAACQSHTGRLTGPWFLPKLAQGLNTNLLINTQIALSSQFEEPFSLRTKINYRYR
jgi:hypothetical protein